MDDVWMNFWLPITTIKRLEVFFKSLYYDVFSNHVIANTKFGSSNFSSLIFHMVGTTIRLKRKKQILEDLNLAHVLCNDQQNVENWKGIKKKKKEYYIATWFCIRFERTEHGSYSPCKKKKKKKQVRNN